MQNSRKTIIGEVVCNTKEHEGTLIVVSYRDLWNNKLEKTISRKSYFVVDCPKKENKKSTRTPVGSIVQIEYLPKRISKKKFTKFLSLLREGGINENNK